MIKAGLSPEDKIFQAAQEEFIAKGYDGARMQSIADRASISKAALHYYFRSKERLFRKAVSNIAKDIFGKIRITAFEDIPFKDKIGNIVDLYMETLIKNQEITFFLFSEMMKHPNILDEIVSEETDIKRLFQIYRREVDKGNVADIDPRQLFLNVVSMCIYPILGRPLISRLLNLPAKKYDQFLNTRKDVVKEFVIRALRP